MTAREQSLVSTAETFLRQKEEKTDAHLMRSVKSMYRGS